MGRAQKESLRALTAAEQQTLQQIAAASSARVDRVRRATAVLAVAQGQPFAQAAQQVGWHSASTVAGLVARFNRRGLAALTIAPGRGRKPRYDAAARAVIVQTAQQPPDRQSDGTATWSLSLLQRRLRQEASFTRLGASTIRGVLQDAGSSYQRTRTWCPTGTAKRKRKAGVVTVTDPLTEEKRG